MKSFILFMHADTRDQALANDGQKWGEYFASLHASGCFEGGSAIGQGIRFRRDHPDEPSRPDLGGFVRVRAESLADATRFLAKNPIYQAGGTVEIRELPPDE